MAKAKQENMGLFKEIQKVFLDDADFLRDIVKKNLQELLQSEFDEFISAGPYERTESRSGYRNASYTRKIKTRVGSIELEVLRDREGNFSTELFRRYQRNEQAFVLSMIEMYIQGVSKHKKGKIANPRIGRRVRRKKANSCRMAG